MFLFYSRQSISCTQFGQRNGISIVVEYLVLITVLQPTVTNIETIRKTFKHSRENQCQNFCPISKWINLTFLKIHLIQQTFSSDLYLLYNRWDFIVHLFYRFLRTQLKHCFLINSTAYLQWIKLWFHIQFYCFYIKLTFRSWITAKFSLNPCQLASGWMANCSQPLVNSV